MEEKKDGSVPQEGEFKIKKKRGRPKKLTATAETPKINFKKEEDAVQAQETSDSDVVVEEKKDETSSTPVVEEVRDAEEVSKEAPTPVIEEIVAESIAAVDNEPVVSLNLEKLKFSASLKNTIQDEFHEILKLLDFKDKAHDIFRRWYIDGRVYYQKMIDAENTTSGIQELRYIDPRKIKKVRQVKKEKQPNGLELIKKVEEYYIYNEHDTIAFCPSGIMDLNRNLVVGYLHKAIKPVNQLKMMADSLVIYRIARAPERRIFYIDVGNLPKLKAEQYMRDIMARYRNKIVYDSATGDVKDDRKFMTMLEDFWLPRREGFNNNLDLTLVDQQRLLMKK